VVHATHSLVGELVKMLKTSLSLPNPLCCSVVLFYGLQFWNIMILLTNNHQLKPSASNCLGIHLFRSVT